MKKKFAKKQEELFVEKHEEPITHHHDGKICTGCGKKKDTKKIGKEYLCKTCREEKS